MFNILAMRAPAWHAPLRKPHAQEDGAHQALRDNVSCGRPSDRSTSTMTPRKTGGMCEMFMCGCACEPALRIDLRISPIALPPERPAVRDWNCEMGSKWRLKDTQALVRCRAATVCDVQPDWGKIASEMARNTQASTTQCRSADCPAHGCSAPSQRGRPSRWRDAAKPPLLRVSTPRRARTADDRLTPPANGPCSASIPRNIEAPFPTTPMYACRNTFTTSTARHPQTRTYELMRAPTQAHTLS